MVRTLPAQMDLVRVEIKTAEEIRQMPLKGIRKMPVKGIQIGAEMELLINMRPQVALKAIHKEPL